MLKKLKLPSLPSLSKFKKEKKGPKKAKKIRKNKRAISLQYKLIGSLVIFASLPVIIVSILSVQANEKTIENSVGTYSQSMIEQFGHSFNGIIDQTRSTITQYMLLDNIQNFTVGPVSTDHYENYQREMAINAELQTLINGNNILSGVVVAGTNDRLYHKTRYDGIRREVELAENTDIFSLQSIKDVQEGTGAVWFHTLDDGLNGIYLGWDYSSYQPGTAGIIIASVDEKQVQELIDIVSVDGMTEFYIADEQMNIVLGPDEDSAGSPLELEYIDNIYGERNSHTFLQDGKLVSFYTLKNGWKAIYEAPLSVLMSDVAEATKKIIVVALICILLAIGIGYIIATSICRPIQRLSEAMAEAETGNLGVEYTYDSNNEVGQLVSSFNHMINNIKALVLDTKMVAETIESNTETLQVVSESTATSSNQITQAIESIAAGTEGQTVQIINSSEMMDKLSENINFATHKVQEVQEVANNTMKLSNDTVSTMEELMVQSEKTIQISTEVERHIEELGDEASQITNVISMIQSISEQTNLLALNATIEAARAGEAGRGFGVVADEIRKLANQSKEATSKIEDIIISIMNKKDTSIQGAREATNLIAMQRPIVDNTNDAFKEIHEEMESVVTQLDELRELFGMVTSYKDDAVVSISEISDIIGNSASAAEEVFATSAEQSTSADSIADMANILLRGVEELKAAQQKFRL